MSGIQFIVATLYKCIFILNLVSEFKEIFRDRTSPPMPLISNLRFFSFLSEHLLLDECIVGIGDTFVESQSFKLPLHLVIFPRLMLVCLLNVEFNHHVLLVTLQSLLHHEIHHNYQ